MTRDEFDEMIDFLVLVFGTEAMTRILECAVDQTETSIENSKDERSRLWHMGVKDTLALNLAGLKHANQISFPGLEAMLS